MKAPQRIHKPPTEPHEGWVVEDIFGERYFVYKGDWQSSRATYRWWIDQPNNPIHCEETREACFRKIQEWEDLKVKKALDKAVGASYITSTADNKVPT